MKIGDKVKVFDSMLFKDDFTTPPSITFKTATIVKGPYLHEPYVNRLNNYLVDVRFEYDGRISHGHFTEFIEEIV